MKEHKIERRYLAIYNDGDDNTPKTFMADSLEDINKFNDGIGDIEFFGELVVIDMKDSKVMSRSDWFFEFQLENIEKAFD